MMVSCGGGGTINYVQGNGGEENGSADESLSDKTSNTLRIVSFNIRCINTSDADEYQWDKRKQPCVDYIKDANPDFLGFQELRPSQATWFEKNLSEEYGYYDICRDTGGAIKNTGNGEGVGIIWKKERFTLVNKGFFWLAEDPSKLPAQNADGTYSSWNSACRRIVVWGEFKDREHGNKTVYFMSTHFDHKSDDARKKSSDLTISKVKEICKVSSLDKMTAPVFVVADFNCTPGSEGLAPLEAAFNFARPATDATGTYNAWGASSKIIDHIFYKGNVKAGKYQVVTENEKYGIKYLSDHYPIQFDCTYDD